MNPSTRHVLIVSNDPTIQQQACSLATSGWLVETAPDTGEALRLLDSMPVSVLLAEVAMPGMDGISLLRAVRSRDPELPVILMTGQPSLETAMQAMEHEVCRYLIKPIRTETLVAAVDRAARRRARALWSRRSHGGDDLLELPDHELSAAFDATLGSLWTAYQPIVQVTEKRVIAYEALLRTRSSQLLHPLQVLRAAERLGRSIELGRHSRLMAAGDSRLIPESARLFVNITAAELDDSELYDPSAPLSAVAHRVVLEITEREPLDLAQDLPVRIKRLRDLGFRIAIDDLGAGYASLSSFAQIAPDFVKIDMSIVRTVDRDPVKRSIVRSLIMLMRELRMQTICEGVETVAERNTLLELGCDLMQGFLFAHPGPPCVEPRW